MRCDVAPHLCVELRVDSLAEVINHRGDYKAGMMTE